MAAFLSKVFSRKDKDKKKDAEDKDRIPSPSSPTTRQHSQQDGQDVADDKDKIGLGLFRPKSQHTRTASASSTGAKRVDDVPQLKLNLDLPILRNQSSQDSSTLGFTTAEGEADFRTLFVDSVLAGMQIDDTALGEARLSPAEALSLMSACVKYITERGLDTLGIMHPHWHSASPTIQRRLIALFLHSISPPSTSSTPASPSVPLPSTASAAFATELDYTRSPHDVAAVFRWALRHLRLEGDSFDGRVHSTFSTLSVPGASLPTLTWYDMFAANERAQSFPLQAFSELVLPQLPRPHADLLLATTGLISSLAAHSEWNGVSSSKLTMALGHYLLTGNRVDGARQSEWVKVRSDAGREGMVQDEHDREAEDGWIRFYRQWEHSGRALEHLFLAQLRDESSKQGTPKRLTELVQGYPFSKQDEEQSHFTRPRYATRSYDALLVRTSADIAGLSKSDVSSLHHPLRVAENALRSELVKSEPTDKEESNDAVSAWEEIRSAFKATGEGSGENELLFEGRDPQETTQALLASILSDDSVRLLALRPDTPERGRARTRDGSESAGTPTVAKFAPVPEQEEDSLVLNGQNGHAADQTNGKANGVNGSATADKEKKEVQLPPSGDKGAIAKSGSESTDPPTSPIASDWNLFSSAGFTDSTTGQALAASLADSEKSRAQHAARRSLKRAKSPTRPKRTKTVDGTETAESKESKEAKELKPTAKFTTQLVSRVTIDEAFVDFWSDALLDPVASSWPVFVVCQLRSTVNPTLPHSDNVKIGWIVIEQVIAVPTPGPTREQEDATARRASSPKPSMRSEVSIERKSGITGRLSSTFSRRFAFLGMPADAKEARERDLKDTSKKAAVKDRVGEMGEVIPEEPVATSSEKDDKTKVIAAAAGAVALGGAVAVAASVVAEDKPQPEVPQEEEETAQPPTPPAEKPSTVTATAGDVEAATTEEPVPANAVLVTSTEEKVPDEPTAPVKTLATVTETTPAPDNGMKAEATTADESTPADVVEATEPTVSEVEERVERLEEAPMEPVETTATATDAAPLPTSGVEVGVAKGKEPIPIEVEDIKTEEPVSAVDVAATTEPTVAVLEEKTELEVPTSHVETPVAAAVTVPAIDDEVEATTTEKEEPALEVVVVPAESHVGVEGEKLETPTAPIETLVTTAETAPEPAEEPVAAVPGPSNPEPSVAAVVEDKVVEVVKEEEEVPVVEATPAPTGEAARQEVSEPTAAVETKQTEQATPTHVEEATEAAPAPVPEPETTVAVAAAVEAPVPDSVQVVEETTTAEPESVAEVRPSSEVDAIEAEVELAAPVKATEVAVLPVTLEPVQVEDEPVTEQEDDKPVVEQGDDKPVTEQVEDVIPKPVEDKPPVTEHVDESPTQEEKLEAPVQEEDRPEVPAQGEDNTEVSEQEENKPISLEQEVKVVAPEQEEKLGAPEQKEEQSVPLAQTDKLEAPEQDVDKPEAAEQEEGKPTALEQKDKPVALEQEDKLETSERENESAAPVEVKLVEARHKDEIVIEPSQPAEPVVTVQEVQREVAKPVVEEPLKEQEVESEPTTTDVATTVTTVTEEPANTEAPVLETKPESPLQDPEEHTKAVEPEVAEPSSTQEIPPVVEEEEQPVPEAKTIAEEKVVEQPVVIEEPMAKPEDAEPIPSESPVEQTEQAAPAQTTPAEAIAGPVDIEEKPAESSGKAENPEPTADDVDTSKAGDEEKLIHAEEPTTIPERNMEKNDVVLEPVKERAAEPVVSEQSEDATATKSSVDDISRNANEAAKDNDLVSELTPTPQPDPETPSQAVDKVAESAIQIDATVKEDVSTEPSPAKTEEEAVPAAAEATEATGPAENVESTAVEADSTEQVAQTSALTVVADNVKPQEQVTPPVEKTESVGEIEEPQAPSEPEPKAEDVPHSVEPVSTEVAAEPIPEHPAKADSESGAPESVPEPEVKETVAILEKTGDDARPAQESVSPTTDNDVSDDKPAAESKPKETVSSAPVPTPGPAPVPIEENKETTQPVETQATSDEIQKPASPVPPAEAVGEPTTLQEVEEVSSKVLAEDKSEPTTQDAKPEVEEDKPQPEPTGKDDTPDPKPITDKPIPTTEDGDKKD